MSSPARDDTSSSKPTADTSSLDNESGPDKALDIAQDDSSKDVKSSPPELAASGEGKEARINGDASAEKASTKSDSDAETIVLPGKEIDTTPTKRKSIKHEDSNPSGELDKTVNVKVKAEGASSKAQDPADKDDPDTNAKETTGKDRPSDKDGVGHEAGNSSGLSSALSSPAAGVQSSKKGHSESDQSRSSPPHISPPERAAASDIRPRKRKLGAEGADEKARDGQDGKETHETEVNNSGASERRETRRAGRLASPGKHLANAPPSPERSTSPQTRSHRRAASTQSAVNLLNGKTHKRRKVAPPPLATRDGRNSDDGHSDSSSASGSPHPNSHLRKLTGGDANLISPAKMPHKKHRDQIGRTFLARACAANETENARIRLRERPEDVDIADNAGNTPLQIASLEGSAEIVKLLIEHSCDIDCKNNEKDTPLIDAVENGHLEVVKLLLGAGANPRQGNLNGEEPLDLLNPEDENHEAIRSALIAAKNKSSLRRQSEDHSGHNSAATKESGRSSRGASAASPRHSPPMIHPRSPPVIGPPPRRKTVRSEATRNDLLWMKPTAENLRDRAGKGDMAGVANILNVLSQADPESLIAAARGGHDEVIQLLLGIGGADADAPPIRSIKVGYNTPMLAAIGRGNEKVIQLLLEQPGFDPTRRDHRGHRYYEIAQERQGLNWEKEYEILKEAYDRCSNKGTERSAGSKSSSPATTRNHRETDKEKRAHTRPDASTPSLTGHKKKARSPVTTSSEAGGAERESASRDVKREPVDKQSMSKHKSSLGAPSSARSSSRPTDTRSSSQAASDHERSSARPSKAMSRDSKRRDSGTSAISDGEGTKPRRKLVSGKVIKGDREVKRRSSQTSAVSLASGQTDDDDNSHSRLEKPRLKQRPRPSSSGEADRNGSTTRLKSSASDSDLPGEGSMDEKGSVKRVDSKNRLTAVRGEGGLKRARTSQSPARSRSRESESRIADADESKKKRRRLEAEGKDISKKRDSESVSGKSSASHSTDAQKSHGRKASGHAGDVAASTEGKTKKTPNSNRASEASLKSQEENDAKDKQKSHDSSPPREMEVDGEDKATQEKLAEEKAAEDKLAEEKRIEERKEQEAAEEKAKEARELQERLDRERAEQLEREQAEEQERVKRQAEEDRKKAEAEERARRIQAEKEEAERKAAIARAEEEARAEAQRRVEEAERQARLAREEEQARAEKKRREEEMQRRRAEQERLRREEAERRRAEQEQRERLELLQRQEQQERARREALPYALQRLAELPNHLSRTVEEAQEFMPLHTVTLHQLDPSCPPEQAQERYIINFQAAGVLGVKDLALSQCQSCSKPSMDDSHMITDTAWSKRPITERHKVLLWRVVRTKLQAKAPMGIDGSGIAARDRVTQAKFRAMEPVFWIKVCKRMFNEGENPANVGVQLSDFNDIIPRYPHLQGMKITTLALRDLDRQDPNRSPFALPTDPDGWTVTPFQNGGYTSYSPIVNQQMTASPQRNDLFRPVFEPDGRNTAEVVVPNGVLGH